MIASLVYGQISPGDLSKGHSNLEGLSNCTKCHELGEEPLNTKCLDCHKEIKDLVDAGRGLHSNGETKSKKCFECHSEHNGVDFKIIHFNEKEFDHAKAGYILEGKHKETKCEKCHTKENIQDVKIRKKDRTFIGLETSCKTCHKDIHSNQFSKACESCHSFDSFKPAIKFDHNKTNFKLTGKHTAVECAKCHKEEQINNKQVTKYKNINFSNCQSCHNDFHKGKFGNDCQSCHTTASFNSINKNTRFNHSLTNYPLEGLHVNVACQDCHGETNTSRPKHNYCTDCHPDYHDGQFTRNNLVDDCSECHSVNGFNQTTYNNTSHNSTKFPLYGAHSAVPCNECHYTQESWQFKFTSLKCVVCHANPHGNSLQEEFLGDDKCNNCHTSETWAKINFNHSTTSFKLLGKHAELLCSNCHIKTINVVKEYRFKDLGTQCETCHNDIHNGQFAEANNQTECQKCHGFNYWKPAEKFDHNSTNFILDGKHAEVNCSKCHKFIQEGNKTFIQYKIEEIKCENCHS